jgi:hypothetical protein
MNSLVDNGLFEIELGKSYQILVETEDFSGNKSIIETYIEGIENERKQLKLKGKLIETDQDYLYSYKNKEVYFPKNTFFETVKIQILENEDEIEIGPNFFPIANPYEIKISFNETDSLKRIQTFIAKKTKKSLIYLPTQLNKNHLTAKINELGTYTFARDSVAPSVVPNNG